jgi:hypothetical protein
VSCSKCAVNENHGNHGDYKGLLEYDGFDSDVHADVQGRLNQVQDHRKDLGML